MSIYDEIVDRCGRKMLFPLIPIAPGATIRRAMFIGEDLHNTLNSPEGDEAWEERMGNLRADLEHFVTGEEIHWKYLFLLSPAKERIWEIRSARDEPSIRVLGLFAAHDTFVSTTWALRADLGGWQSGAWKKVKLIARAIWRQLFNTYNPMEFTNIHQMVSGALSGKYFK